MSELKLTCLSPEGKVNFRRPGSFIPTHNPFPALHFENAQQQFRTKTKSVKHNSRESQESQLQAFIYKSDEKDKIVRPVH